MIPIHDPGAARGDLRSTASAARPARRAHAHESRADAAKLTRSGVVQLISSVKERRETLITHLNGEIRALDKELKAVLLEDPAWGQSAHRLMSIPGIGLIAAAWILVATLNFTTCDTPEQAASFAGLVPRQKQSGASDSPRHIGHAGHARLTPRALSLNRDSAPLQSGDQTLLREADQARQAGESCCDCM